MKDGEFNPDIGPMGGWYCKKCKTYVNNPYPHKEEWPIINVKNKGLTENWRTIK